MATPERLLLGVEIGGTKLQLGLGDAAGRILAIERIAAEPAAGAEGIRAQIAAALEPWLAGQGVAPAGIEAVGIGFGGPVNAAEGRVVRSFQVAGWEDFPLAEWFRLALKLPSAILQNDADTAALGEARFGAGAGLSPVLYVNSGSGIGGGLVIDGRVYNGRGLGAIEIGHLRVTDPASTALRFHEDFLAHPPPEAFAVLHDAYLLAGETHTLESIASGWGIERHARELVRRHAPASREWRLMLLAEGEPERITAPIVAEAARLGDRAARKVLERATTAMGRALAQAITLLAPRRVVLGGGVSLIGEELWLAPIRREIDRNVFEPFRGTFDLVAAEMGEAVVIHGALALAADHAEANLW